MKVAGRLASVAAAITLSAALVLSGASAGQADPPQAAYELSRTTVAAGGTVVVTGYGWGPLTGVLNPRTLIQLRAPSFGHVVATLPASSGPWTYELTVPSRTVPSTYDLCVTY